MRPARASFFILFYLTKTTKYGSMAGAKNIFVKKNRFDFAANKKDLALAKSRAVLATYIYEDFNA